MICIYCGFETSGESSCPYCGKDLSVYRRIMWASNAFYNEGLDKARVRDLSGAEEALNRCLKWNKYHIEARNLLGLVYFESGQMVMALREWVISQNFQPKDNRADYYLAELQRGQMNKMDQITKKYNLAIDYCRAGDYDLAKIQLKRVLSKNSSAIHAHQLLALLYLRENNPEAAKKQLTAAAKIDVNNATTLIYLQEANDLINEKKQSAKRRRKKEMEFSDQEENPLSTKRAFVETIDSSRSSILNVTVGIIVGVLASIFLILPTMRQSANEETVSALLSANEEAVGVENSMASLQDEVDRLQEKLDEYEGQADVKKSYELLLETQEKVSEEDWDSAISVFSTINRDLMDPTGQKIYDGLDELIHNTRLADLYDAAKTAKGEHDLEAAIAGYEELIKIDELYADGVAMFSLAECYRDQGEIKKAKDMCNHIIEVLPDTKIAGQAEKILKDMSGSEDSTDEAEE